MKKSGASGAERADVMKKNGAFGIDMMAYCRRHEKMIREAIAGNTATPGLTALHRKKIRILQHERLIHLLVTVMVVFVELFVLDLVLLHPETGIVPAVILLGLAILLGLYFLYYFYLENTVQRWYALLDELPAAENLCNGVRHSVGETPK